MKSGPHKFTTPATSHHAIVFISMMAIGLGIVGGLVAPALTHLIGFVTNLSFYGRISTAFISPSGNRLGVFVIVIPVIGGILVGLMARFGTKAIRGHGIPEAMEQVLENDSRIPARIIFLKPISAAISIGTGGPFGAEGPIIATGGALGSVLGQILSTTAAEGEIKQLTCRIEKLKAQVRAKVEHPFHVVKNLFGHRKVRYRGLAKNTAQLHTLFGLANLVLAKRVLLAEARA